MKRIEIGRRTAAVFIFAMAAAATITGSSGHGQQCNCNPGIADAELTEWDLPVPFDTSTGAITVDIASSSHGRLWFVSRVGDVRLYRLDPAKNKYKQTTWTAWDLNPLSLTTGGIFRIKVHKNQREVFVRTHTSLQKIDTGECTTLPMEDCERTTWFDQLTDQGPDMVPHVSDLSSDDCNVYTTTAIFDNATGTIAPGQSYVQQLSKCRVDSQNGDTGTTTVKRWTVGGGAGYCEAALDSQPCISGVSVDPKREYLVYFAEPGSNKIGELDVRTNNIRRWSLAALGADVLEPRQLDVDYDGTVWAITGSGHIVRLDPKKNRMSKHLMPAGSLADPFGVAPDHGVIGYTNSAQDQNKVAMVFPRGNTIAVTPATVSIQPALVTLTFMVERAGVMRGVSDPIRKTVHAQITEKADGVFVEANIADGGSMIPLGITPDQSSKVGTYFYAVGLSDTFLNRVGKIELPYKQYKHSYARDDDDFDKDGQRDDVDTDDDDDGVVDSQDTDDDNDCVLDSADDDDDNDGIADSDDDQGKKEQRETREDDVAAGQYAEYEQELDASNLLLAATATSLNPASLLKIEIYNPAGQLVASSVATPGIALATAPTLTAGIYKVRVKNLSLSNAQMATQLFTRAAWPIELPLP